jgi:prepilin-type processing-associated H-X9-DG protein
LIELLVVVAIISILAAVLFPVFASAREKARQTACLANGKQIGMAFLSYTQDYDERLPLTTYPVATNSWTDKVQPYIKSAQILRCPDDTSQNWDTPQATPASALDPTSPAVVRRSSYFLNAYMAGSSKYGILSEVRAPAAVIYVAESLEGVTRDHFHPFNWNGDQETPTNSLYSSYMHSATWNSATGTTSELALARHSGGTNYVYLDGHSKWRMWSQAWYVDPSAGVWQGDFDPRRL